MKLSIIVCSHNPRRDYWSRVMRGLEGQTLAATAWELIIVDNASEEPLHQWASASWKPDCRIIREDELGLTPARLRGIAAARGELLVFVDDDLVLAADYLERTGKIGEAFPFVGAWGGNIEGEFEQTPPAWLLPHASALALRKIERDSWSNYHTDNRSMPCGAGLCVRAPVAKLYAERVARGPALRELDRRGDALLSAGDVDLAMTAYELGYGTGMFRRLHCTHLIPQSRLSLDYMLRLLEAMEYSTHLLRRIHHPSYKPKRPGRLSSLLHSFRLWRLPEPDRSLARAQHRGWRRALAQMGG